MTKTREDTPTRCAWARSALSIRYHDEEWGVPVHHDRTLFEFLILEGAQAGLSWETILNKRENYRAAFDNFDPKLIARYDRRIHGKLQIVDLPANLAITSDFYDAPAAIVGFSGMLAGAETLPHLDAPPPVLLVHGDADQVIPPSALFMSATTLGAAGVPVQWHLSKGLGHGIDPFGLGLAQRFLVDAFSGRAPRTGPVTTPFAR